MAEKHCIKLAVMMQLRVYLNHNRPQTYQELQRVSHFYDSPLTSAS